MRIENPTLVHFRHFSSLFTNLNPLHLSRALYKSPLFMQNKANFLDALMNVTSFITTYYENKWQRRVRKNKPNSNPIKPNFRKAKMNVNSLITKDYRKKDDFAVRKNKPNSNPISEKPKMNVNLYVIEDYENETAFRPKKTNPIKPNFKPNLVKMGHHDGKMFFTHLLNSNAANRELKMIK